MNMRHFYPFCVALIMLTTFSSCQKDKSYDELSKEQLEKLSNEKYSEIKILIGNHTCENSSDWKISKINGLCADNYIFYHKSVNEEKLNSLIVEYNTIMTSYATIVLPYTNCTLQIRKPTAVICTDGKAELKY